MDLWDTPRDCPDCGATIGEHHKPGCDIARCARCGGQRISCGCINELYGDDPQDADFEAFDAEWNPKRKPWSGIWPGIAECKEYGIYCRRNPCGTGHISCRPDEPGASESLSELALAGRWDVENQRFVMSEEYLRTRRIGVPR